MLKKILLLCLCMPMFAWAIDSAAVNLMLINNYNLRQNKLLWDRMRDGFKLEHPQNKLVRYYERIYTHNKRFFALMMANARPYMYYLLTETERNGLPSELALLPGVESTFDANARSYTGAYGMWQFLPSTAERFNLVDPTGNIDKRQDIVASTRAALSYLNYLYRVFGNWEVAIAAYNWGEGNMYHAVLDSGQSPGHIDYDDLSLRTETKNYLPKLIALASIIANPAKFGINLDEFDNQPYFAIIKPGQNVSVNDFMHQAQIDKKTFKTLNPEYKDYDYIVNKHSDLLLPIADVQNINPATTTAIVTDDLSSDLPTASTDNVSNVNSENQAPQVVIGDTDNTADTTDTDSVGSDDTDANDAINQAAMANNDDGDNNDLTPQVVDTASMDDNDSSNGVDHDTATNVVNTHTNTQPTPVVAMNSEKHQDNNAELNDLINKISTQDTQATAKATVPDTRTYVVTNHDTLYSIAKKFHVSMDMLKQQNHIPGSNLIVGQTLLIPSIDRCHSITLQSRDDSKTKF